MPPLAGGRSVPLSVLFPFRLLMLWMFELSISFPVSNQSLRLVLLLLCFHTHLFPLWSPAESRATSPRAIISFLFLISSKAKQNTKKVQDTKSKNISISFLHRVPFLPCRLLIVSSKGADFPFWSGRDGWGGARPTFYVSASISHYSTRKSRFTLLVPPLQWAD